MSQDNWRLRLGWVCPSIFFDSGWEKLLPEGAQVMAVTTASPVPPKFHYDNETGEDDLREAKNQAKSAAKTLDNRGMDCIIGGGSLLFQEMGPEREDRFVVSLNEEFDAPYTTSSKAISDALQSLQAQTLIVVTPYPDKKNNERKKYLERRGFDVVAIERAEGTGQSMREDLQRSPSTFYRKTKEVVEDIDRDFDAINIPCAPFQTEKYIEPIEKDTGKPVVTSISAYVWKAFELAGIHPDITGYGKLFNSQRSS